MLPLPTLRCHVSYIQPVCKTRFALAFISSFTYISISYSNCPNSPPQCFKENVNLHPSVFFPVSLYFYGSTYFPKRLSVLLPASLSVSVYFYLSFRLSFGLSLCLSVYLSVHLFFCLSQFVCLSLSVRLSLSASVCVTSFSPFRFLFF